MKSKPVKKELWFSTSIGDLRFCFVCSGRLRLRSIQGDHRERLVCSMCSHITYTNPKSVAGLIPVMPDGRVALLRRKFPPAKGKWSNPAGYQELGETVADAAVRETMEEICVRAKATRLLGVYSYPDSSVVTIVYEGKVLRGEKPTSGIETDEVRLFRRDQIPWKELAFQSTVDALKAWVRK